MDMAITTTEENFATSVLEESKKRPVLVDFWAEWCGPCRMLGPVLDKLESEYKGRFLLAKLDTDKNQSIAARYQISGIPAVKLFFDGKVVDEFVGALPESGVRNFLENNIPDPFVDILLELAKTSPMEAADKVLEGAISGKAGEEILWTGVLAGLEKELDIKTYLDAIPEIGSSYSDPRNWLLSCIESSYGAADLKLIVQVADETRSREILDLYIQKIENSSGEEKNIIKQAMFVMFFILGTTNPLVLEYRRKLSSLLF